MTRTHSTPTLQLADDLARLTVPARMDVFGLCVIPRRRLKRQTTIDVTTVGWQGWNDNPTMESRMARLPGSGSFYWSCAWQAYVAARRMMRNDASIHQIKIETISGRELARMYR